MESSVTTSQPGLLDELILMDGVPRDVKRVAKRAKKMGRPTKLTPSLAARIVKHVLDGSYIGVACAEAGITKQTLRNWKARAEEMIDDPEVDVFALPPEEKIYVEFFAGLQMAEAGGELKLLRTAARGEKGWQAAMTILERRHPTRWGRSEHHTIEGGERPVVIEHTVAAERQRRVAQVLQDANAIEGTATEVDSPEELES